MARSPNDDVPWLAEGVREERATLVPRARLIGGGLVAVLLAVLVALGVFLAAGHKSDGSAGYARPEDAPLIAADPGPYKVAPANPGGAQITGIDDSVAAIASGSEQPGAIAADTPEEPLARPTTGAPTDLLPPPRADAPPRSDVAPRAVAPIPVTPARNDAPRAIAPAPVVAPAPPPAAPPPAKPAKTEAKPKPAPADAAADTPKAKPAEPKAKVHDPLAEAAPTPAGGGATLQLGAFSTRDKADAAWAKVAGDGALSGLAKHIEPVTRDGATLYRLRAAGVPSPDAARALCARIKASGNACIVADAR